MRFSFLAIIPMTLLSTLLFANEPAAHQTGGIVVKSEKISATVIVDELRDGNKRFVKGEVTHPLQNKERRTALISGQKPNAIVLTCSDSRVPPELIFDKGIGEIFVVRNAGNIADSTALASIEYALEHLGSRLIVIMGHDSCGAVKATLSLKKGESAGSKNLDQLVKKIEENFTYSSGFSRNPSTPDEAIVANVRGVVASMIKNSKIIKEFIMANKVTIAQAVYHFDSGEVEFMEIGRPLLLGSESRKESVIKAEKQDSDSDEKSEKPKAKKRKSSSDEEESH